MAAKARKHLKAVPAAPVVERMDDAECAISKMQAAHALLDGMLGGYVRVDARTDEEAGEVAEWWERFALDAIEEGLRDMEAFVKRLPSDAVAPPVAS